MRFLLLLLLAQNPSPARDSTYAWRVDPAKYPGQDYVLLLEDGTARLESDGRSAYTLRQVVQVLTTDGADTWGELAFWYAPPRQSVHINWIRVIGPDGTVVRDGPEHQEETSPTVDKGAPVYSDRRAIQATLGGVAPGTIVDYSYTLETLHPQFPGDFKYYWGFNGTNLVRRSRFTLDVPADLKLPFFESNLDFKADDRIIAGRRVRTWATSELPAVKWQSYAGSPNDVMQALFVGGARTWPEVATWYDSLLIGRFAVTPEVLAAAGQELRRQKAKTREDSVHAMFRWVAQDFRYVSLSLGDGGYQPRVPAEVFRTRFGDCKDKAVLFISLLRHMGLNAYPVLVNADGYVDSLLPGLKQFDHMIAAVERDGRVEYADPTRTLLPYGELPGPLQGQVGLALPGGRARVVVLPASSLERNRYDREVAGAVGLDGRFTGRITITARGTQQGGLREKFSDIDRQDSTTRADLFRHYARLIYETAVVDSVRYFEGRDLDTVPRVTVWFSAANVVGHVGAARYYFNLPMLKFVDAGAANKVEEEGPRRFPIDIAEVTGPSIWRSSLELELPEGWKADVPADVSISGPFGYYRANYKQVGRMFHASREMGGARGLLPRDSVSALLAWFRGVSGDATKMIVMERGTGGFLATTPQKDTTPGALGELGAVLPSADDLSEGARVASEGAAKDANDLLSLSSRDPIEGYQRTFAPDQMIFRLGSSRFAMLQVAAAAFHSTAEAQRSVGLLSMIDLPSFFETMLGEKGLGQATMKAGHTVDLTGIGDRAFGQTFQLVTPLATFDLALLIAARNRVDYMLLAIGPQTVADTDLVPLLRKMDARLQQHHGYAVEVAAATEDGNPTADADSAMRANTPVALDKIVARPSELSGTTSEKAIFFLNNGFPQYRRTVDGYALTFPVQGANAVSLQMDAMWHNTEAQALKRVLYAESGNRKYLFAEMLSSGFAKMLNRLVHDSSTTVEVQPPPAIGARSYAAMARMRSMFRSDIAAAFFANGKLSVGVIVTQLPGTGQPGAAVAVARAIADRARQSLPRTTAAAPSERLIQGIRRVIAAEQAVDSLVDARNFDAAFAAVARADLAHAPVGFWAATWYSLCWEASLRGLAGRPETKSACDAAVAVDTTEVGTRDSRGLARALAGDTKGAVADFTYVVDHAKPGEFLDKRAGWLETLRAGNNPFTERVLAELRDQ
jgi:Domain of Unknown Function with PDB structure (DUF3857)/Transglutaminase-like superfamily